MMGGKGNKIKKIIIISVEGGDARWGEAGQGFEDADCKDLRIPSSPKLKPGADKGGAGRRCRLQRGSSRGAPVGVP